MFEEILGSDSPEHKKKKLKLSVEAYKKDVESGIKNTIEGDLQYEKKNNIPYVISDNILWNACLWLDNGYKCSDIIDC